MTSLRADERMPSEHPRYFRVTAVRSYTVPIVEKFVERAKPFVNGPRANARVQTLSYSRNRRGSEARRNAANAPEVQNQ